MKLLDIVNYTVRDKKGSMSYHGSSLKVALQIKKSRAGGEIFCECKMASGELFSRKFVPDAQKSKLKLR